MKGLEPLAVNHPSQLKSGEFAGSMVSEDLLGFDLERDLEPGLCSRLFCFHHDFGCSFGQKS